METKQTITDVKKGQAHIIVEIIEYLADGIVSKTVIKKITGNVTASSFSAGEEAELKSSPYDIYIQIIDGIAQLQMNEKDYVLHLGEGFIIPAHSRYFFSAKERFKMLSTVIKSGYEDA